jgi:hypothetical protein
LFSAGLRRQDDDPMKWRFVCSALLLVACSKPQPTPQDALTAEIERMVQLPDDAGQLQDYARFYAWQDRKIVGVYIAIDDPKTFGLAIGAYRWLDDPGDLPAPADGGCSAIDVVYDAAAKQVESATCHSVA